MQAWVAGRLDLPKVFVICELAGWLQDLPTARGLVERAVAGAEDWTTGQLRTRLRRWVLAVDPQAAARRAAVGVSVRRVETSVNPDGTGEVWGRSLPPQDCAAAWERLGAIARAAKAAGDERTLAQLRADAMLDLLIGEGVAVGEPVGAHTAGLPPVSDPLVSPFPVAAPLAGSGDVEGVSAPAWDPSWPAEPLPPSVDPEYAPSPLLPAVDRPPVARPAALPAPRRGVVELQVPLLTLLRLAEEPAELGGWGPVVADIARQVASRQTDGTWRFHLTDELGGVAIGGITRQRPAVGVAAHVRARDHTCVAPGCRHPARSCDIDHSVAKLDRGHSGPDNLGCLCRTHHRFKHAEGTHLVQFAAGCFGWTTPRGLQYTRRPHHPLTS